VDEDAEVVGCARGLLFFHYVDVLLCRGGEVSRCAVDQAISGVSTRSSIVTKQGKSCSDCESIYVCEQMATRNKERMSKSATECDIVSTRGSGVDVVIQS
jgi:hypothetical protein